GAPRPRGTPGQRPAGDAGPRRRGRPPPVPPRCSGAVSGPGHHPEPRLL
ncbi:MAG: hypothetical protein AVDCRST_MAG70-173, partial [uncultured Thermomicrobiales bacterium]